MSTIEFTAANFTTKSDNQAFWSGRVQSTDLYKDLSFLRKAATATAQGTMTQCQIISGIGGIGKTHVYTSVLQAAGKPYEYIKAGTVLGLVQDLERCAKEGKVALLDDPKPAVLKKEDFQLVLMAATGPKPRLYRYATMTKKRTYDFSGLQLVVLTNMKLDESQATDMFAPLLSRSWSCSISGDRQEIFDHACYLAICEDMLRHHGSSLLKANLALEYFAQNMHRLPDVSARTLVKIVDLMTQLPDCWREAMDRECAKDCTSEKPYAGKIPQIVVDAPAMKAASVWKAA